MVRQTYLYRIGIETLSVVFVLSLATGCGVVDADEYRATVRRTTYGIPHIIANDWGSLGFGEGYAMAEDHLCSVADQVIRVRSERARFFGAGPDASHILSDFAFQALEVQERARDDLAMFPPNVQLYYEGFASGYNDYLAEVGRDNLPGWCQGEPWVGPIEAVDLVAYGRSLFMVSTQFAGPVGAASPPNVQTVEVAGPLPQVTGASNGWAIGTDRSESGGGMLLANPHYPWVGSNRFWEKQLTIPGEIDAYGVGLLGIPGIGIGFNEGVAWTHTVSSGVRFTLYRVPLVEGEPTVYYYDGDERAMEESEFSVEVLQEDGSVETVRRKLYRTHYGPVLSMPGFNWTDEFAFAIRDANLDNNEVTLQWLAMAQARDMETFQAAHAQYAAMPWVNTIATSRDGRAWYADVSSTPNLSNEAIEAWNEVRGIDPMFEGAYARNLILLDGGNSLFEWTDDPGGRDPGLVPFSGLPQLERRDYVFNANDSYWLANSGSILTGYRGLHALQEGTPRSPRTRMNDLVLSDQNPGGAAGDDGRFSLEELMEAAFLNRSLTAELLVPAIVEQCRRTPEIRLDDQIVSLSEACEVLSGWDGRFDLESRGAVLWREFITRFEQGDLLDSGVLFADRFDPADPVGTPKGLASGANVLDSLGRAVIVLDRAGFPLDVQLGELQHNNKNSGRIPIHGGHGFWEGVTNFTNYAPNRTTLEPDPVIAPLVEGSRFLREDGYPVNRGTSFIMALEFADDGPRAMALLTYSESGNPDSLEFKDQTELFSRKEWRRVLYLDADIDADPNLRTYEVSAQR